MRAPAIHACRTEAAEVVCLVVRRCWMLGAVSLPACCKI